jgi:hypothetical protein
MVLPKAAFNINSVWMCGMVYFTVRYLVYLWRPLYKWHHCTLSAKWSVWPVRTMNQEPWLLMHFQQDWMPHHIQCICIAAFCICQILKKRCKYNKIVYLLFIDFKKVTREVLYSASHSWVASENVGLQKEQKYEYYTFACHTCNEVRLCVLGICKKEVGNTKR